MSNTSALRNHALKESKARWATLKMDGYYQFLISNASAGKGEKFISLKWQSVVQDEDERGQTVYEGLAIEGERELKDPRTGKVERIENVANLAALLDALGMQDYKNELADRGVEINEAIASEIATRINGKTGFGYFARRRSTNSQSGEAEIRSERRAFALKDTYEKAKQTGARFRVKSLLLTPEESGATGRTTGAPGAAVDTAVSEEMGDLV